MINGIDFSELDAEKYYSITKSFKGNPKAEIRNRIFSGQYIGSRKMDGAYFRFIKDIDGSMRLQGRSRNVNGVYLDKIDHVPHLMDFFNSLPNGTCLLGELYFPNNEGSNNVTTIIGCLTEKAIKRQEVGDKLHYYVFDVWAYDGESYLDTKIEERVECLNVIKAKHDYSYVEFATYYTGAALWNELEIILANGGEGIVMTKLGTTPEPGKRRAWKTLKVKKEISQTIDCFFTGRITPPTRLYTGKDIDNWEYWQEVKSGEMKYGKLFTNYYNGEGIEPVTKSFFYDYAGSLEVGVIKNNKTIVPIGYLSGLTEEIKKNYIDYKGKPIEITAMEIFKDKNGVVGGLRHAKFLRFRPDLSVADCTYEKIFDE